MPRSANAARRCPREPSQRRARRSRPSAIRKGPARTEQDVTRHLYRSSQCSAPGDGSAFLVVWSETKSTVLTRHAIVLGRRDAPLAARARRFRLLRRPPRRLPARRAVACVASSASRLCLCLYVPLPLPLPLPLHLPPPLPLCAAAARPRDGSFVGPTTEPPRDRSPSTSARRRPPHASVVCGFETPRVLRRRAFVVVAARCVLRLVPARRPREPRRAQGWISRSIRYDVSCHRRSPPLHSTNE